ncbi:RIP metalloprotease RseP [Catenisphaera adipataccumulans]|uniref:Zinc metalloprotease n=1 Tax=Catenisphaera adipataccumulans TaxID=700500 RepID=A0A7W8CYF5_9FIRM|nr:RIP metalloprotease RseP [Catenisphaera adipataccumulans]MBB5183912.1 regulator of sigma E protease [Catenisphaera adipataccumulans]
MDTLIGIIAFIFMLSVIIIVHELGHFLVARHFGVYCHEFSIGMGPLLYQKKGKETNFSIRAVPLGGYVMMAGEEDGSQDEEEDDWLKNVPEHRRLNNLEWWKQILVMLAGIFVNVVLAWVIFIGVAINRGYVVEPAQPVVYQFTENSAVKEAGLKKGDRIIKLSADGETEKPKTNSDVAEFVQYHHKEVTLTVKRDKKTFEVTVKPTYDKETSGYYLGYQAVAYARYTSAWECFLAGNSDFAESATAIFKAFGMLIQGEGLNQLSGPVGIYQVTSKSAQMGLRTYLSLFAMISLNIGIFNAFPLPALDGGRVLIVLLERIFRRKINPKIVETVIVVSFVLLMMLMVYATYNDILRLS